MPHYLLDTNIFSEGARKKPDPKYLNWLNNTDNSLFYTSCLVFGEAWHGVDMTKDARKKDILEQYWNNISESLQGKTLEVNTITCQIWADLRTATQKRGKTLPEIDGLIAAQALEHKYVLVTRNAKHFREIPGLQVLNPWEL